MSRSDITTGGSGTDIDLNATQFFYLLRILVIPIGVTWTTTCAAFPILEQFIGDNRGMLRFVLLDANDALVTKYPVRNELRAGVPSDDALLCFLSLIEGEEVNKSTTLCSQPDKTDVVSCATHFPTQSRSNALRQMFEQVRRRGSQT